MRVSIISITLVLAVLFATTMAGFKDGQEHVTTASLRGSKLFLNDFADATANDGPWIVRITPGTNADFFAKNAKDKAAKCKKPKKNFKINYEFPAEKEGDLNAVAIDGISYDDLLTLNNVESIESDAVMTVLAYSWGVDRIDQLNLPLSNSYTSQVTGCGVDVYVLDTGIDTTHTEFQDTAGTGRIVQNIYNAYSTVTPIPANTDGHGHGTHCAGTVGGKTVGVATCANLYGLKVLSDTGTGSTSGIIDALNLVKARHLANPTAKSVVSMSLGGTCSTQYCPNDSLIAKVQELANIGIVSAIAAGNSNILANTATPAAANDAITVAASTSTDVKASYSNYGNQIDIYAPGSSITSACSSLLSGCTSGTTYSSMSGTSMATPHVAGVLAQQMKRLADANVKTSYATLSDVDFLRSTLLCDSVANKVTGNPTGTETTTTTLLQQAKPASTCAGTQTSAPTRTPTRTPTQPPVVPPSTPPTEPPTTPPTNPPTTPPTTPPTEPPTTPPTNPPTTPVTEPPTTPVTNPPTTPVTEPPVLTPTAPPTEPPALSPTEPPTAPPSEVPTDSPVLAPTLPPSAMPVVTPTRAPTTPPTRPPTTPPTRTPTRAPTRTPTRTPTRPPTRTPTRTPTRRTARPTRR